MKAFMTALPNPTGHVSTCRAQVTTWLTLAIFLDSLAEPPFQSGEK